MAKDFLDISTSSPSENFSSALKKTNQKVVDRLYQAGTRSESNKMKMLTPSTWSWKGLAAKAIVGLEKVTEKAKEIERVKQFKQEILERIEEQTKQIEGQPAIKVIVNRFTSASRTLQQVQANIVKERDAFVAQYDTVHTKYLPDVTEARAQTSGTQEQVQQQEQQQQQQQTQISGSKASKAEQEAEFSKALDHRHEKIDNSAYARPTERIGKKYFKEQCKDWGMEKIYFSTEASAILSLMPRTTGDPWCKIAINSAGDVLVITPQDYQANFAKASYPTSGLQVYDPLPGRGDILVGTSPGIDLNSPPVLSDEVIQRKAIVKLRLGFNQFTEPEKVQLRKWWNGLDKNIEGKKTKGYVASILKERNVSLELFKAPAA